MVIVARMAMMTTVINNSTMVKAGETCLFLLITDDLKAGFIDISMINCI